MKLHNGLRILVVLFLIVILTVSVAGQDRGSIGRSGSAPSVLCDPDNPQLIDLAEQGQFQGYEDNGEYDGAVVGSVLFSNDIGQTFQLSVTAAQTDRIESYLDGIALCVEVLEIDDPVTTDGAIGVDQETAQFFREVILGEALGISPEEVDDIRSELTENGISTLPEFIRSVGGDLDYAYQLVDEFALDHDMFEARGMPLLDAAASFPSSASDYTSVLQFDPLAVIVEIVPIDYEREFARSRGFSAYVAFYIDPTYRFGSERYHYYRAKCTSSATAGIMATHGGASLQFWRYSPYKYIGTLYSSGGYSSTSSKTNNYVTHDLQVRREGVVGTTYAIYGGWYQGWGGYCG